MDTYFDHDLFTETEADNIGRKMPCGIFEYRITKEKTVLDFFSFGAAELLSYSRNEFVSLSEKDPFFMIDPEDRTRIKEYASTAHENLSTALHLRDRAGKSLWVSTDIRIVPDENDEKRLQLICIPLPEESGLYYSIANYATNGIYVIDRESYELLFINQQFERTLDFLGVKNAKGRKCYEALIGRNSPCEDCIAKLGNPDGKPCERSMPELGRYFNTISHSTHWKGHNAAVIYINDITETKRANEEVRRLYNNIPGAVFRCRFNEDWSVLDANDGLFSFLGYTREEFAAMGNKMSAVIYPEDHKIMTAKISAQLKDGRTTVENENRLVCKDGTVKWISIKAQLMEDIPGEKFFYCVFVDISKQKEEELRISAVEKNLAIAMQHAEMVYWEYDIPGSTAYVNDAATEWFGVPTVLANYPESYLKLGFVAEEYIPIYMNAIEQIQSGTDYLEFEAYIKTLQSGYEWMRVRMTNVKDDEGKPVRAICTGEKIAEYKELENRFMTTLRQNDISSWRYDIARKTIILNKRTYYSFYRTGEGEIPDVPESQIRDGLCHPDDVEILRRLYRRMHNGERHVEENLRFLDSKNKSYRWKRCIYTVVDDNKGRPTYALGSAVDITEQVESKIKYEAAVEYRKRTQTDNLLLSGHCSVTDDEILEMTDLTGRKLLEKFGSKRDEFFKGLCSMVLDPEKQKEFNSIFTNESMTRNFELGMHESTLSCEISFDEEKKERVWIHIHIDAVKVPETNHLEGFLTVSDVTAAHVQEQILDTVVEYDYDYVSNINLGADTIIMYQKNKEEKLRNDYDSGIYYSYLGFIENAVNTLVIAQDRELFRNSMAPEKIRQELSRHDSYEFICHIKDMNGNIRAKRARFASYNKDSDSVIFARIDVTDMLEQQEEQNRKLQSSLEAAEEANQAKSKFLSRVSHDMRTPLNGILGLAALMREKTDWSEIQDDLTQLQLSGQYLLNVINDTLDVSKIENGMMELKPTVCGKKEVLETTLAILEPNIKDSGVKFSTHMEKSPNAVLCVDVGRIEQLFTNIIGNSIKFTPKGGSIDFTLETLENTESYMLDRIVIKDTGIGMKPEFLPHLFEPFSQEDTARTSTNQGTGLGMSIAKQIVTLMGGEISVKSEPGKGTEFTFTLKLPKATLKQIDEWNHADKKYYDLSILEGKRILMCEDHPLNAQIATRLLRRKSADVETAENGRLGVEKFSASPEGYYDMILMDIRMPELDGIEATKRIRALNRTDAKSVPIIAMTANAMNEDVADCLNAGMNSHIAKPIEPKIMYETIAAYMK